MSFYNRTQDPYNDRTYYANLRDRLITIGVPVKNVSIDIQDFKGWLDNFSEIEKHYQNMGEVFIEKCLEHYLAFRCLEISDKDIYIDIAGNVSPWANVLRKRNIRSYSLDLIHTKGIHGYKIGANAGDTKLPDEFASVLSAQCAYECFVGDSDIQFIKEADRILNKKGRYGILPLYLDDKYFVAISPYFDQKNLIVESEAKKVWRDDGRRSPYSRHYSPESFKRRIYSNIPAKMNGQILYFENLTDLMKCYPDQRIYCFFMFFCNKKSEIVETGNL
jgi:hypothetical protein